MDRRLAKMEFKYFEKPDITIKNQIKEIKKEIKKLTRIIMTGKEDIEEQPIVIVKKSDPYTFGSSKPKTGDLVLHTRTIPKLLNMWSMNTEELQ